MELLHENPAQRVQGPREKTAKNQVVKEYLAIHMHEGNLCKVESCTSRYVQADPCSPENMLLKTVVKQPPI